MYQSKDGWINDLQFYFFYNSISIISGRSFGIKERLCATEPWCYSKDSLLRQVLNLGLLASAGKCLTYLATRAPPVPRKLHDEPATKSASCRQMHMPKKFQVLGQTGLSRQCSTTRLLLECSLQLGRQPVRRYSDSRGVTLNTAETGTPERFRGYTTIDSIYLKHCYFKIPSYIKNIHEVWTHFIFFFIFQLLLSLTTGISK